MSKPNWLPIPIYAWFYRTIQKTLHHFNLHHTKKLYLEDGATQLWCQWCGLRQTTKPFKGMKK